MILKMLNRVYMQQRVQQRRCSSEGPLSLHVTGKKRGSAHTDCNLSNRFTNKINVIFHNLRGYDSHLIMQEIGKFNKDINVIPYNMEKYMAFMIDRNLIFMDSFQFMNQSLSNLANNLPKDGFYHTKNEFG